MGSGILSVFEFQDGIVVKKTNGHKSGTLKTIKINDRREPVLMIAPADSIPLFHYQSRHCGSCNRSLRKYAMVIVTQPSFVSACYHCEKWNFYKNGKGYWKNPERWTVQGVGEEE